MEAIRGLMKKAGVFAREVSRLGISWHAAGAGYFMVLSLFPLLILLLGLLRHTGISLDVLTGALAGVIPQALLPAAKRLLTLSYRNTSGFVLPLSALAALWSAGRGIYALMRGLNRVYHRQETRSWLRVRWLSMLYTGGFLTVVLLSLGVDVFGDALGRQLPLGNVLAALTGTRNARSWLLLAVQCGLFCAMFMVLPNGGNRFLPSVPGALLACLGWRLFSGLYSRYITLFTGYSHVFGSVYAVALSMLWLYICLCILFFGGAWNDYLGKKRK